ncbi:MAG: Holliday junction resolvase RuvX [Bacillota bacterium]|nr:Holliday junction resolvase RuvX [Bacillota bacterium]
MAGRILALDLGFRRVGTALSDPLGLTAQGGPVLTRKEPGEDFLWALPLVMELVKKEEVVEVVVGIPRHLHGEEGVMAKEARRFAQALEEAGIPTVHFDERWTSRQAERILLERDASRRDRRRLQDRIAAMVLLQTYLESRRFSTGQGLQETGNWEGKGPG